MSPINYLLQLYRYTYLSSDSAVDQNHAYKYTITYKFVVVRYFTLHIW